MKLLYICHPRGPRRFSVTEAQAAEQAAHGQTTRNKRREAKRKAKEKRKDTAHAEKPVEELKGRHEESQAAKIQAERDEMVAGQQNSLLYRFGGGTPDY